MILAIIGSRGIEKVNIKDFIPQGEISLIISGGAKGVDSLAEGYAEKNGIECRVIRPDYDTHGRKAPLVRDREIAESCDILLAIWDGSSRGTAYTVNYARSIGKKVILWRLSADSEASQISLY